MPSRSDKPSPRDRKKLQRALVAVIKASREDSDLSRRHLAERLGLTYSQIVNMENGRRAVGLIDFVLLAEALNIEPKTLLDRVIRW